MPARKTRKLRYETIEIFVPFLEYFVFRSFDRKGQVGVYFRSYVDWPRHVDAGHRAIRRFQ
jgi:hypothetical protein